MKVIDVPAGYARGWKTFEPRTKAASPKRKHYKERMSQGWINIREDWSALCDPILTPILKWWVHAERKGDATEIQLVYNWRDEEGRKQTLLGDAVKIPAGTVGERQKWVAKWIEVNMENAN